MGYDSADHSDARFLIKIDDKHGFDLFLIIIDKGIAEMVYLGLFQPLQRFNDSSFFFLCDKFNFFASFMFLCMLKNTF